MKWVLVFDNRASNALHSVQPTPERCTGDTLISQVPLGVHDGQKFYAIATFIKGTISLNYYNRKCLWFFLYLNAGYENRIIVRITLIVLLPGDEDLASSTSNSEEFITENKSTNIKSTLMKKKLCGNLRRFLKTLQMS